MMCLMECHHQSREALKTFKNSKVVFCHSTPLLFCESSSLFENWLKVVLESLLYWSSQLDDVYFSPTDLQTTVERVSCMQKHFTLNMPWISSDEICMQMREHYFYVHCLSTWTCWRYWNWMVMRVCFLTPVQKKQCWNTQRSVHFIACTLQQTDNSVVWFVNR